MSFRKEIIRLASQEGTNIRELCRRFKVSEKTFYKWRKRWKDQGEAGLDKRLRRPHQSPRPPTAQVGGKNVALRKKKPAWGPRKLRRRLMGAGGRVSCVDVCWTWVTPISLSPAVFIAF